MYSRVTLNTPLFQPASTPCKIININTKKSNKQKAMKLRKTVLCEPFEKTGICSFGTRCKFAHGEDELQSLLYCQVIEPQTYRTRPCPILVSTGFCPMKDLCEYRHDPRYADEPKHFLKVRKMENSESKTDMSVDTYRSLQDEAVNNSTPIGPILPHSSMQANVFEEDSCSPMRRRENEECFHQFHVFYKRVTAQKQKHSTSLSPLYLDTAMSQYDVLTEIQRLKIAKMMRKNSSVYTFKNTHIIFFDAVMIVQARRFIVEKNGDYVREITDDNEFIHSSQKVVSCHEIAFGPVSNNDQGSALFFDLPQSEIQTYDVPGNKHKKLQKELALKKEQAHISGMPLMNFSCACFQSFPVFYTDDQDMNELVDKIMQHKINDLSSSPSIGEQLELEKLALFNRFSCLFKHWQKMSWPVDVQTCTTKLRKFDEVPKNRSEYEMKTTRSEDHDDGFQSSVYLRKIYKRFVTDMEHERKEKKLKDEVKMEEQSKVVVVETNDITALPQLKKESLNMLDRSKKTRCWTSLLYVDGSHDDWDKVELGS